MRGKRHPQEDRTVSKSTTRFGSPLRIAIATAPRAAMHGISLAEDIRLLKPALLYADVVTLYSPSATMLLLKGQLAGLSTADRMTFLKQVYPLFEPDQAPLVLGILEAYERLQKQKRGRSRDQLLAYLQLRPKMEKLRSEIDHVWNDELTPTLEELLASAGADQIAGAVSAGLLEISPLIEGDKQFDADRLVEAFVTKLADVLADGRAYPLFDDQTGTLVRQGLVEGRFQASPVSRERGKQAATASDFMGRLPAFPRASVAEILDIRTELEEPLVRFRSAMVEMGKLIESSAYEEGFREQVDEVYRAKVEPALVEIDDRVRNNGYLRVLVGEVVGDTKTLLAGILALGVAQTGDLPQLFTVGAAAAGQAVARTTWERRTRERQISEHALYFLYRTEELLADRI